MYKQINLRNQSPLDRIKNHCTRSDAILVFPSQIVYRDSIVGRLPIEVSSNEMERSNPVFVAGQGSLPPKAKMGRADGPRVCNMEEDLHLSKWYVMGFARNFAAVIMLL